MESPLDWLGALDKDLAISFPVPKLPGPVFHYTTARGFKGIVEDGVMRATDYRFLNDTEELIRGEMTLSRIAEEMSKEPDRDSDERRLLSEFVIQYNTHRLTLTPDFACFIASFCEDGDMLSQWRGYCDQGMGYSLGFEWLPAPEDGKPLKVDIPGVKAPSSLAVGLLKCEYDERVYAESVRTAMEKVIERTRHWALAAADSGVARDVLEDQMVKSFLLHAHRHAGQIALSLKHESFADEREWRLLAFPLKGELLKEVKFRETPRRGLVPYVEIALKRPESDRPMELTRMYVGPGLRRSRGEAMRIEGATRTFLRKHQLPDVIVDPSYAPFLP
jgi:hypothetical protein